MVSNTLSKSLGYGGSLAIKAKSITNGGGSPVVISKKETASNGPLKAAANPTRKTFQNRGVTSSGVNQSATTKDTLQKGGSRYGK